MGTFSVAPGLGIGLSYAGIGAPDTATGSPSSGSYTLNDASSQLLGPDATNAANSLYADPNANPSQTRSAVNDLFGAAGTAAQDAAQAQAQGITAEGDQQEANSYLTASGIADSNARLERVSGGIQQAQEDRTIYKTLSGQASDVAGAGFNGDSLSALYLHADSAHQGQIAKSLIGTQTEVTAGGFDMQSAAAKAEAQAAQTAAAAASTLEGQASSAGAMLQANALNNAASLLNQPAQATTYSNPYSQQAPGGGVKVIDNTPSTAKQDAINQAVNTANARADATYNNQLQNQLNGPSAGPSYSHTTGSSTTISAPDATVSDSSSGDFSSGDDFSSDG